jgi:hypothetical protein
VHPSVGQETLLGTSGCYFARKAHFRELGNPGMEQAFALKGVRHDPNPANLLAAAAALRANAIACRPRVMRGRFNNFDAC